MSSPSISPIGRSRQRSARPLGIRSKPTPSSAGRRPSSRARSRQRSVYPAGIIIKDTLVNDTRRYRYGSAPNVIDLGLRYGDIEGLTSEPNNSNISDERLAQAGLGRDAIEFLHTRRVELNAMTSRQLIDFVEDKLKEHSVGKIIPDENTLTDTYHLFATSDRLSEAFDEMKEKLDEAQSEETIVRIAGDFAAKVRAKSSYSSSCG